MKRIIDIVFIACLTVSVQARGKTMLEWFEAGCMADNPDKQIKYFNKALKLDPNFVLAYKNRAFAKEKKGNFVGAITDYSRILELKPGYSDIYLYRAIAREKIGNTTEAFSDYSKAIELNPMDQDAYNRRGRLKEKMGNKEESLLDFQKAARLNAPQEVKTKPVPAGKKAETIPAKSIGQEKKIEGIKETKRAGRVTDAEVKVLPKSAKPK
ncbi:MAG: hypothetical protein JW774_01075, partial [Candidatus Aureabacteria bacterium]|nr:hypothetical protein [Candidatus Auribacterota bacterium]